MSCHNLIAVLAIAAIGLSGCAKEGKEEPKEAEASAEGAKLDAGKQYMMESGQRDLDKISKKKPEELSSLDCAAVMAGVKSLSAEKDEKVQKYVATAKATCGHDVPLAILKRETAKIEAIRKEKPNEKFMSECVYLKMSLDELKKFGHEKEADVPKAVELHKAACE